MRIATIIMGCSLITNAEGKEEVMIGGDIRVTNREPINPETEEEYATILKSIKEFNEAEVAQYHLRRIAGSNAPITQKRLIS